VLITEYFSILRSALSQYVDRETVSRRYEYIVSNVCGSSVAQTASCWLDYPVWESNKQYHTVLATDEFFTYTSPERQQTLMESVIASVQQRLIITVRDFKNSHRSDINSVFSITSGSGTGVMLVENTRADAQDRQSWYHTSYLLTQPPNAEASVQTVGTVQRRAVYFKQLAKFCFDAGCKRYRVIPNVIFRPLFKRHAEHVIIVDF
jgi:hypothetical protein